MFQVLAVDFAPCGVKLATGSDDNTVRLWDLRRRKAYYTMPAHTKMVSSVRYSDCGDFLFSGSYDRASKVLTNGVKGRENGRLLTFTQ